MSWGISVSSKEQAMTTLNLSARLSGVLLPVLASAALLALAGCEGGGVIPSPDSGGGGGGPSVNASPYLLFASNYVVYGAQTNGAFVHSVQGGDLYGKFAGGIGYGCYNFAQPLIDSTQLYAIQAQANSNGGPPDGTNCQPKSNSPPTTAADFAGVTILAPGTNSTTKTSIAPLDISQASTMLLQAGNIYTQGDVPGAVGGNATVFTVELNNDTSLLQDGSAQTALCSFDQTLATIGRGSAAPLGVLNYVIPFSSFACSIGSMTQMLTTGVTSVTIKVSGDKNPSMVVNELDVIAVGYIGFTK
jgi:hypothetical protein